MASGIPTETGPIWAKLLADVPGSKCSVPSEAALRNMVLSCGDPDVTGGTAADEEVAEIGACSDPTSDDEEA